VFSLPAAAQPATGVLSGTLLGVDSLGVEFPLGARRVSFRGSDSLSSWTDAEGRFVLRVPSGERLVRFQGLGGSLAEARVVVRTGDTTRVTLRLPVSGYLSGFVYGREDANRMDTWRSPREIRRAADALGWFREARHPGRRELWVWANYDLFEPERFTRLVVDSGGIRGEVVEYWTLDPYNVSLDIRLRRLETQDRCDTLAFTYGPQVREPLPDGDRYCQSNADYDCRPLDRVSLAVCRVRLDHEPDWAVILGDLERHDVWTLPDETALPPSPWVTTDGWYLLVRAERDHDERWYAYMNPSPGESIYHDQARSIAETLRELDLVLAPIDGD
jgi:hypothetical protein